MERTHFSRLTGVAYVVSAIFGLIFSIGGLAGQWITKPQVTDGIEGTIAVVGRSLTATTETLQIVTNSLEKASTNLEMIHGTLTDVSGTMESSKVMVTDAATMMGGNMVDIVHQTQTSLKSAGNNLKVVDDTLRLISRIPFIGANYQPDIPLQESFNQVSKTLDPLPASFTKMSGQLTTASGNIATLKGDLDSMAGQIAGIQDSISDAHKRADDYTGIIKDLQSRYDYFQSHLPLYINVFYIGFTGLLVWMLMTQLAMLLHGLEMFS